MGKEAALAALKTRLEGITIANGFPIDVKKVTRQFSLPDKFPVTAFPLLILEDDGPETIDHKTGGFADINVEINVFGYVRSQEEVSTKLNELEAALVKRIYTDQTLGGVVGAVSIEPVKDRSGSVLSPFGFFVRPVKLFYEVDLKNDGI